MDRLPFLAQRLFNTPLAIAPDKLEVIVAALAGRFGVASVLGEDGQALALVPPELAGDPAEQAPYEVVGGVAILPIEGTLVQRSGWMSAFSGMTGYDSIRHALYRASTDDEVRAIVLHVDSGGGEAAGCFDLADAIFGLRGQGRPIWAVLDECAYSAAYALACAADYVTVPRTGGAGSIGVVALLRDLSRAMDREGVTVNIFRYGARKADGNAYEKLPPEAAVRIQSQIDQVGELFVRTVARNRGLTQAAVRDTEAATFGADEALKLGLVDAVMAPDEAMRALLASLG